MCRTACELSRSDVAESSAELSKMFVTYADLPLKRASFFQSGDEYEAGPTPVELMIYSPTGRKNYEPYPLKIVNNVAPNDNPVAAIVRAIITIRLRIS